MLLPAYLGRMKYAFLAGCLLLTSCSTAPPLTPQQAAVTAFLNARLPDATSYEPVRWAMMTPFRAGEPATMELRGARCYYASAKAKLLHDSAAYVRASAKARQSPISDEDLAYVKMDYQASLTNLQGSRAYVRGLLATQEDTTRLGYRLFHVFRAKTEEGKLLLDSAGFLVNPHGVVICNVDAHNFYLNSGSSNREQFLGIAPTPPPPPPVPPVIPRTPEQIKAYLKAPMQR